MRKDKAGGVEMHTAKRETHDDKIEVIKERILDINPDANVTASKVFYTKDTISSIDLFTSIAYSFIVINFTSFF